MKEINREALLNCTNEFIREQETEEKHGKSGQAFVLVCRVKKIKGADK